MILNGKQYAKVFFKRQAEFGKCTLCAFRVKDDCERGVTSEPTKCIDNKVFKDESATSRKRGTVRRSHWSWVEVNQTV